MQVVHEVCCGLDVRKKSVTARVLWAAGRRRQTREFGTFTRELLELADWLRVSGVTRWRWSRRLCEVRPACLSLRSDDVPYASVATISAAIFVLVMVG